MDPKLKHLEIIQAVVTRMAGNTFLLKGWCVTLIAALCAVAGKAEQPKIFFLAYLPIILFGGLDAYYLWHERRFRDLYNIVRSTDPNAIDFSMNISTLQPGLAGYASALCSVSSGLYYIVLAGIIALVRWMVYPA